MNNFRKEDIIPTDIFRQITDIRVNEPDVLLSIAGERKLRKKFAHSGRINIVAADHPARGSIAVGDMPFAMADRYDLLARLVYILQSPWVDGVLGSMDVLEELLILHDIMKQNKSGFLDEKLLIASLNRGGHPGSVWELDDPVTGTDAETCKAMNLDATKMLLRVDDQSKESLKTLLACAEGIREMNSTGIPVFLEPLPVKREGNSYSVIKDPELLVKLIGITAALGNTSRNIWLKIPLTDQFEKVTGSTTLPIVILGGNRSSDLEKFIVELNEALSTGHQVRGAMFGRNILYPESADPQILAETVGKLIHGESDINTALKSIT